MELKTPRGWRKGQTIFNFLWWLKVEKGISPELGCEGRMADPFHLSDKEFDKLFDEYSKTWPK